MHYALCPAWRHPCVDTYAVKGQLGVESRRVSADTLGTEQCSEAETVAGDRPVKCRTGVRQKVCSAVLMLVLKMVLFVNHWLNTKHWGQIFHQPIFY